MGVEKLHSHECDICGYTVYDSSKCPLFGWVELNLNKETYKDTWVNMPLYACAKCVGKKRHYARMLEKFLKWRNGK